MAKNDTAIMLITSIIILLRIESADHSDLSKMCNTSDAVLIMGFTRKAKRLLYIHLCFHIFDPIIDIKIFKCLLITELLCLIAMT